MKINVTVFYWQTLFNVLEKQNQGGTLRQYISNAFSNEELKKVENSNIIIIGKSPFLAKKVSKNAEPKILRKRNNEVT